MHLFPFMDKGQDEQMEPAVSRPRSSCPRQRGLADRALIGGQEMRPPEMDLSAIPQLNDLGEGDLVSLVLRCLVYKMRGTEQPLSLYICIYISSTCRAIGKLVTLYIATCNWFNFFEEQYVNMEQE